MCHIGRNEINRVNFDISTNKGLFLLKIQGSGDLILPSYGAIHEIALQPGESYTVDTGHMVAFDEGVGYNVKRVGGLKSTLFSGEVDINKRI
jgi:uncharacterized protein (AIM24 family)